MDNERHAIEGRRRLSLLPVDDTFDTILSEIFLPYRLFAESPAVRRLRSKPKREVTEFDRQRIAAAEVRRQKKNAQRLKDITKRR